MKDKMNVLFISPFENMRQTIQQIANTYPNIDTTIMIGNEQAGKQVAVESYALNYDCIISRGNTASLIRQAVSMPVIEVRVTLNDILGSLADIDVLPDVVGAVGYRNVISGMDNLKRFLPFKLEIYGFDTPSETDEIFCKLRSMGINTIVCDTITYQLASKCGFDAFILKSGEDSIRYAFDCVNLLQQSSVSIFEENQLLRRLASVNSESDTVVFSQDKRLYYSSLDKAGSQVFDYLTERLADFDTTDKFKIIKQRDGYLYRITARKVTVSGRVYYAYFISRRIHTNQNTHKGIVYMTDNMVRNEIESSVFGITNLKSYYSAELNEALSRRNPVLIFGEVGVGKNHLAEMIYLNSQFTKNPFVFIDFSLLNRQTWDFLLDHNDSPLFDSSNTLFFKNIDALNAYQFRQLQLYMIEGDVDKRNRIIISCSLRRNQTVMPYISGFVTQFSCITINMQPLGGKYGTIEKSINLLLSDYRKKQNRYIGEPTSEAMSLLLHYSWPQNYDQLIRVVNKISTLAGRGAITKEIVSEALSTEVLLTQGETELGANTFLDLTKTLSEINEDIIRILLDQNDGNQSLTAKSLGISRTTMWRMLNQKESNKD